MLMSYISCAECVNLKVSGPDSNFYCLFRKHDHEYVQNMFNLGGKV